MNTSKTTSIVGSEATQVSNARKFSVIIEQLYRAATPGIIANASLGIILVWTLWDSIDHYIALNWLGANLVMNIFRLLLTLYVIKNNPVNEQNWSNWATTHMVATGITSSIWGAAALLFYVKGSVEFQVFFALIVVGMTSAALPIVAIYLPSYIAYFLPSILPLMAVFIAEGDQLHVRMALLVAIYILTMLTTARQYYARILESTNLRLQLDLLAHVDALTGLANRRAFDRRLDDEWRRMMRARQPLSLMVIDVDYFKEYNDSYGHQKGDECLKLIADTIATVFHRSGDFVARLGGEEFVAIIPAIASDDAARLAEQARQAVLKLGVSHPNPEKEFVTVSIGLNTAIPDENVRASSLYELADKALYAAKHEGRNRVCTNQLDVVLLKGTRA